MGYKKNTGFAVIALIIAFANSLVCAQTFEKVLLHGEGSDEGKLVITVFGDGFTQAQTGTVDGRYAAGDNTCDFLPRANAIKELIIKMAPFSSIKDRIKIYAINAYTTSGSYFEVARGNASAATQFPSSNGVQKVKSLIAEHAPTTAVSVIMTKTQVGGDVARPSDRIVCCFYTSIVPHELGHALANLADEDTRNSNLFERPNLSATSDQNTVRWKNFIGIDGITVVEKFSGAGWYVTGAGDLMNSGRTFKILSQAAIVEATARLNMKVPFYGTLFNGIRTNGDFVSVPLNTETNIAYPSGYGFILDFAFHGCDKLQTLTIPADVRTIGQYAFLRCTGLTNIIAGMTTPPAINETTFYGVDRSKITLTIPEGYENAYRNAGWTEFNISGNGATPIIKPADNSAGAGIYGIRFAENIVSDKAVISVKATEKLTEAKIVIYDALGNVVYNSAFRIPHSALIWDLRNTAGRIVANGSYLVVVEATDINGQRYHYSAKLGVKK